MPGGWGWKKVRREAAASGVDLGDEQSESGIGMGIQCMAAGCLAVYGALFATGYWLYGKFAPAMVLTAVSVGAACFLVIRWKQVDWSPN